MIHRPKAWRNKSTRGSSTAIEISFWPSWIRVSRVTSDLLMQVSRRRRYMTERPEVEVKGAVDVEEEERVEEGEGGDEDLSPSE